MMAEHSGIGMTSQRTRDRLANTLADMGIQSEVVLEAIRKTPRHLFVDEALASRAYENTALPIGFSQTISQPYIVAKMTEALIKDRDLKNVLEVGTGCGYQTVIMAQFTKQIYTVERINGLLVRARARFQQLAYTNIRSKHADGNIGWSAHAPFDGIIVAAAPIGVPEALLEQLAIEGRLIIPVGKSGDQKLLLITRKEDGFV
jgi:protein-L-isoaspartate(D-aspartate) O-methyltransferase